MRKDEPYGRPAAVLAGVNSILQAAQSASSEEALIDACLAAAEVLGRADHAFLGEYSVTGARLGDLAFSARGRALARADAFELSTEHRRSLRDGRSVMVTGSPAFLGVPLQHGGRTAALLGLHRDAAFEEEDLAALQSLVPTLMFALVAFRTEQARQASEQRAGRQHDRQRAAAAEHLHRVRNLITVVRSVFSRTVESSEDIDSVSAHFRGRLDTVARVEAALITSPDGAADLEDLVRDELLVVNVSDGPRVVIEGPDVRLTGKVAESLALALHELTTNALKFGALSAPEAKLTIRWETNAGYGDGARLDIVWSEANVPAVAVNPVRSGFGRELIEEALPYRLGAETSFEVKGGGVVCRISLPLADQAAPTNLFARRRL